MSVYWINKLAESDSRLHKEDVLRQVMELAILGDRAADRFLLLVKAAYDPFITFGVKQIPETAGLTNRSNPWQAFAQLLSLLAIRGITGNAARDELARISKLFDSDEWNGFCANVIKKDLRCGISEKTFNKVVGKSSYKIETFGCQLATSCEDRPEMQGRKRLEKKLDGVRVLIMVTEDLVTCYSRNGKVFENFGHIEQQLQKVAAPILNKLVGGVHDGGVILDGEVISTSFQALMKQARRKKDADANDSVFHVFDWIPTREFREGHTNMPQHKRLKALDKLHNTFKQSCPNVAIMDGLEVDLDTAEGQDQMRRYSNDAVHAGYEGIMIKDLAAPYLCKRGTFWLKLKPVITVDLEVTELEEGTGKNQGRLGALVCEGVDAGKAIRVNCGSGFSDLMRDDLWTNRDMVRGQTVEVMADAVTQNQDGTYSLRFPRFVRFRDDK